LFFSNKGFPKLSFDNQRFDFSDDFSSESEDSDCDTLSSISFKSESSFDDKYHSTPLKKNTNIKYDEDLIDVSQSIKQVDESDVILIKAVNSIKEDIFIDDNINYDNYSPLKNQFTDNTQSIKQDVFIRDNSQEQDDVIFIRAIESNKEDVFFNEICNDNIDSAFKELYALVLKENNDFF
jgi:hypothetical protein